MSDEKNRASEIARNIWLAGVGAYGRAVGEAQDRLEKAGVETPKLFRDLVKAGAALEDEARSAFSASQEARQSVEERINRVRENFSLQRGDRGDDLQALHDKIDRLTAQVEELSAVLAESRSPVKKTPARKKAAAKKKTTPRKKATPAKKAAAAKPAAKRKTNRTRS